jgi:hypothetical protein
MEEDINSEVVAALQGQDGILSFVLWSGETDSSLKPRAECGDRSATLPRTHLQGHFRTSPTHEHYAPLESRIRIESNHQYSLPSLYRQCMSFFELLGSMTTARQTPEYTAN